MPTLLPSTRRPVGRHTAVVAVLLTALAARAVANGNEPSAEPLSSVAAVRRLAAADLDRGRAAAVHGTVTVSGRYTVIQDGDSALEIDAAGIRLPDGRLLGDDGAPDDWPPLGAVVEAVGHVGTEGFSPLLRADRLEVIGRAPLPPAQPVEINALFDGGRIFQRVEVRGVVQAADVTRVPSTTLYLEAGGRRLPIQLRSASMAVEPQRFIDAEVKVVGVMVTIRNARGEFLAPLLAVSGTDAIEVVVPPPADPFDTPEVPLEAIARYRPEPADGHRIRCRGTVTYASSNMLFLQQGERGVQVGLAAGAAGEPLAVGDLVEVAGFVDMTRFIGGLYCAVCRRIGSGHAPRPLQLGDAELFGRPGQFGQKQWSTQFGLYDGRLIRCRAVVVPALPSSAKGMAVTLGRRDGPRAELVFEEPITVDVQRRLNPDSEIDVTGVIQIDLTASPLASIGRGMPLTGQVRLRVRRPEDVIVVRSPPWWTPRRLAVASGGLVAAVAAAAVWVAFLRREVRRQTARAVAEESARKEAAVQHEAALRERSIIAADLHDTLQQTLTGIGYQLHVCRNADGDETPSHLSVAARLVDHAAAQLRNTVWSLRAMPDARQPFAESVSRLVELLTAGHPIAVSFHAAGSSGPLHDLVSRELLLVVQEAVSNAVHHGRPDHLEVSVEVADDAVKLVISDDGCGFDDGLQPGPGEGHFGIVGMRERITRLRGSIEIATAPGKGATVVVSVPEPFRPPVRERDRLMDAKEPVR